MNLTLPITRFGATAMIAVAALAPGSVQAQTLYLDCTISGTHWSYVVDYGAQKVTDGGWNRTVPATITSNAIKWSITGGGWRIDTSVDRVTRELTSVGHDNTGTRVTRGSCKPVQPF